MLGRLHLQDAVPFGEHGACARLILPVQPVPQLLAFTSGGRVAALRWEFAAQQPGALDKFLPDSVTGQTEQVVDVILLPPGDADFSIGLLSSDGRFKRLAGADLRDLSGRATSVLKLKDGVQLERAVLCRSGEELAVASSTGRMLRLPIDDTAVPLMGRTAQGPVLMRLLPGESIVGAAAAASGSDLLLISQQGQLKRLAMGSLRRCQRGERAPARTPWARARSRGRRR